MKRNVVLSMVGVSLLLCAVLHCTSADIAHWIPWNDLYHQYYFPTRPKELLQEKENFQGWNFAGRSEFPWLVDIRGNDSDDFEDQGEWANGNLVSSKFVLTVCTAVAYFRKLEKGPIDTTGDKLYNIGVDHTYLSVKNARYWKVLFSDDYTYKSVGNGHYTGSRQIKRFMPHPKCNHFELDYQWGMIELKRPIWPVPPSTSYMPTDFVADGYANMKEQYVTNKADLVLSSHCSVGLWSRKVHTVYTERDKNQQDIVTRFDNERMLNYKIKYAVFPTDPKNCWYTAIASFPDRVRVGEKITEWECMALNSNETLGTVCDRDRGAPIVCDGVVRAVVLAGAVELACNMSNPMPFLVMDIRFALDIFGATSNDQWHSAQLKEFFRQD